jgi:hypothetical protein
MAILHSLDYLVPQGRVVDLWNGLCRPSPDEV